MSWGPGTTAIDSRLTAQGRPPLRVPLSAIFKPAGGAPEALSRLGALRHLVNGDGE